MDERAEMTPKGFFIGLLMRKGIKFPDAEDIWCAMEAYCVRRVRDEGFDGDAYPSLVFDGDGGDVVPMFQDVECDCPVCSGEANEFDQLEEHWDDDMDEDMDEEWVDEDLEF